jgi:hypothetical protein
MAKDPDPFLSQTEVALSDAVIMFAQMKLEVSLTKKYLTRVAKLFRGFL